MSCSNKCSILLFLQSSTNYAKSNQPRRNGQLLSSAFSFPNLPQTLDNSNLQINSSRTLQQPNLPSLILSLHNALSITLQCLKKRRTTMNAELITALSALAVGIITLLTQALFRYNAKKKKITLQELIALYGDNVYAKCPNCNTEIKLSQLQLYTKEKERS